MKESPGFGTMMIGGAERPYHVDSIRQTEAYTDHMKIELDEYWLSISKMAQDGILTNKKIALVFLWSCLVAGAQRKRLPVDFDFEDVTDWFDDALDTEEDAIEMAKPFDTLSNLLENRKKNVVLKQNAKQAGV